MSLLLPAVASLVVFFLASAAQAVSGFGLALVAVPLLAITVGPLPAVAAATVVGLLLTARVTVRERAVVAWPLAAGLSLTGLVGMPFGYLVLTQVAERPLRILIAVVLVILVVVLATGLRLPSGRVGQWAAGITSGVLLTSTGMNGPPLVVLLHSRQLPPRAFRGTLQAVFCAQDAVAVALFAVAGLLSPLVGVLAVSGVLGVPLGWWLGDRLFGLLSPAQFRVVVLGTLGVLALVSLLTAITGG